NHHIFALGFECTGGVSRSHEGARRRAEGKAAGALKHVGPILMPPPRLGFPVASRTDSWEAIASGKGPPLRHILGSQIGEAVTQSITSRPAQPAWRHPSSFRIILAASPKCGLLTQSHTRSISW